MSRKITENKSFKSIDFSREMIEKGDYENCLFENCNFMKMDLSDVNFIECKFINCDFSLARIFNTAFRDVQFKGCKLLALHFENCNKFGLSMAFDACQLNMSTFFKLSLKKMIIKDSSLVETDFSGTDLTGATFDNCNLNGAMFDGTTLEKADFRTAYNYSINPEKNKIAKAKFSLIGIVGLLDKYNIIIE